MQSLNIAVLSPDKDLAAGFCRKFAKGGVAEDVTYYSAARGQRIWTLACASGYPEKFPSAAFAAATADYCVLDFDKLDAGAGELILLLDALKKTDGCIITPLDAGQLKPLVGGTAVQGYAVVDSPEKAGELLEAFAAPRPEARMRAVVDHCFDVKGVGVVALGFVETGSLKVHDRPWLMPAGRLVEIRSLQEHDVDMKEVGAGSRFGASLKGVEPKDMERGFVLAEKKEDVTAVQEIEFEVVASKYLREEIAAGSSLHAIIGMQAVPCKIGPPLKAGEAKRLKIALEKPVAVYSGARILIADLNRRPRVVASGEFKQ
jgi:selenocysteine-specific translation elongation factor